MSFQILREINFGKFRVSLTTRFEKFTGAKKILKLISRKILTWCAVEKISGFNISFFL